MVSVVSTLDITVKHFHNSYVDTASSTFGANSSTEKLYVIR